MKGTPEECESSEPWGHHKAAQCWRCSEEMFVLEGVFMLPCVW